MVGLSVCQSVCWAVGLLVSLSVGQSVCWSVCLMVSLSYGQSVCWSVCLMVSLFLVRPSDCQSLSVATLSAGQFIL